MEKDVFCRIIDHEIPSYTIYEDDEVLAILDISQVTRGHTLVMPKKHYDTFLSTPKDVMHKVMDVAQKIGQAQITSLGAKGVNILANCYETAGQTVMHFHVHVIPRFENGDGFILEMKESNKEKNLPAVLDEIKKELK